MAGFVPSPNTVAVKIKWTLHGRPQLNVLHGEYVLAGPLNPNIAQNIFAAISGTFVSDAYEGVLATTTQLAGVSVLDLRSSGIPDVPSTGDAIAGTATGLAMPDMVSFVLTERTAMTGRSHRGRIYTLGWATDFVMADGTALPAAVSTAVTWYRSVQAAMAAEGVTLAIRSAALPDRPSKPGGTLPAKDYEITPVTIIEARDFIFDTNRRRTDQLHR
jgi:hypothetical protein